MPDILRSTSSGELSAASASKSGQFSAEKPSTLFMNTNSKKEESATSGEKDETHTSAATAAYPQPTTAAAESRGDSDFPLSVDSKHKPPETENREPTENKQDLPTYLQMKKELRGSSQVYGSGKLNLSQWPPPLQL